VRARILRELATILIGLRVVAECNQAWGHRPTGLLAPPGCLTFAEAHEPRTGFGRKWLNEIRGRACDASCRRDLQPGESWLG